MSICPTCNSSIISQTPSKIGSTECNSDCPQEMTCQDGIYASNCIFYSGSNLACSGINFGDSLSLAFSKFDALLCQSAGCKVKVSGTDACCDYLETKVTAGTGVTVTKTTSSGCEKLVISTNPATLVWNSLTMPSSLTTKTGYQTPQFSNKDELGRVWFRGSFTFVTALPIGSLVNFTTQLPANSKPVLSRVFLNGRVSSNGSTPPEVVVQNTGVIYVKNTGNMIADNKGQVSFDGFFIDTNV